MAGLGMWGKQPLTKVLDHQACHGRFVVNSKTDISVVIDIIPNTGDWLTSKINCE